MTELHESPELHAALHQLTDGPPPDLANLVVAGAVRRRTRTRMLTVAATLATVLAIALPLVVLQHRAPPGHDPGPPSTTLPLPSLGTPAIATGYAHPPIPGGGPQVLDAFVISPNPGTGISMLLDRATGHYVKLPFSQITLSPDGTMLAVRSRGADYGDPTVQVGVVSRADALAGRVDRVRWLAFGSSPVWSPDGGKLLVDTTPPNRVLPSPLPSGLTARRDLAVFQVGSWQRADLGVTLDAQGYYIGFGWSADSSQLVYPLVKQESTPDHTVLGDMQYLHLDGTPGQRVRSDGDSISGVDAYSPSRHRVIVGGSTQDRVVDSSDWHTVMSGHTSEIQFVGWYDEDHVIAIKRTEPGGDRPVLQVLDMSGRVTKQVAMPGNTYMLMQFRSSAGLTGDAAKLGF
jgi:hypothetical protein